MTQKTYDIANRASSAAMDCLELVARFAGADFSTDGTLAGVVGAIQEVLGASGAALLWLERDHAGRAAARALSGGGWSRERSVDLGQDGLAQAIRSGESFIFEPEAGEAATEGWLAQVEELTGNMAGAVLCAPLAAGERPIGAILLFGDLECRFDRQDSDKLDALAGWLAGQVAQCRALRVLQASLAESEALRTDLLHSRDTLRALFDNVPTSMYIIDKQYRLAAINHSRAALVGEPPRELVYRHCFEALFNRQEVCPGCQVPETFAQGLLTQRLERRVAHGTVEFEITSFPIQDNTGEVTQAILFEEDVTEKLRLQASLAQSEKLAAVGQLAAGVAHEINNPLTAVIANAQLLGRALNGHDEDLHEMAELILQAGERASQVVGELLDLARKDGADLGPVDLNTTLRKAMALLQHRLAGCSTEVVFEPQAGLPPALGSPDQLVGVWINLLGNALDAMGSAPGTIRVTTWEQADRVCASITDSGPGIAEAELVHIFEPFYTTKPPGQGTGLGLPICHSIVRQHGGEIQVTSQAGVGTTLTVLLPLFVDSI